MRKLPAVLILFATAASFSLAVTSCTSEGVRDTPETQNSPAPAPAAPPLVADAPRTQAQQPPTRPLLSNTGFTDIPGFATDFSRSVIRANEVMSGGPPKDGIPALDAPSFVDVHSADAWLTNDEPVFVVTAGGATHVYPVRILVYHEIVNDTVGGMPLTITYCPLCNSGLTFRRTADGVTLDFGTTGRLRRSNLVMYDRQTESWWQQATGEGLVGAYAGSRLEVYPMLMLPWDQVRDQFDHARVMSRETGFVRSYGTNPYAGYDSAPEAFLYRGPATPGPYSPMDRVLEILTPSGSTPIPYSEVRERRVMEVVTAEGPVAVFWSRGTASALDTRIIADGRDVGTANAFRPVIQGRKLSFEPAGDLFRDRETGSVWDATGTAVSGELEGVTLEPVTGVQHFWFSYSAFENDGR